jgi:hypothetical protein
MAKVDKSQYTKEQWRKIKEQRRLDKQLSNTIETNLPVLPVRSSSNFKIGFVLGNGTSRKNIDPAELLPYGKLYGCNALYRTFQPDYLVAVDVKMILEINKAGYQHTNAVWTNPNKTYAKMQNLNYFHPSKGWSSGPTALWLASQHAYDRIYILGFDYKGLDEGKKLNNIYADTVNYKKSTDSATFFGNWLKQTASVLKENPNITYYRVITSDNYVPDELNKFNNLKTIYVEDFKKQFNLS